MTPSKAAVSIELEVPFHDVDPLQVVWHGHYYKYMELARTALLRSLELDVDQIVATGYRLMVIESKCRYIYPLQYGDRFRVTAKLKDVRNRINIGYEMENLTAGRRAARGHTILVTLDGEGSLLLETPDALLCHLCDDR